MVTEINSQVDYEEALEEIEKLMNGDPEPQTPEGLRLDFLATLVQQYEKKMGW